MSYEPSWNAIALKAKIGREIQGMPKGLVKKLVGEFALGEKSLRELSEEFDLKERFDSRYSNDVIDEGIDRAMYGYKGGFGVEAYSGLIPKSKVKEVKTGRKKAWAERSSLIAVKSLGLHSWTIPIRVKGRKVESDLELAERLRKDGKNPTREIAKMINRLHYHRRNVVTSRGVTLALYNHRHH